MFNIVLIKTWMRLIELVANKVWGGGEQYVYDIAKSFSTECGTKIIIVAPDYESLLKRFQLLEADIKKMPLHGYADVESIVKLACLLKKDNAETVIHVHDFKRAFIALMAKMISRQKNVRVVMTRHLIRKAKKSPIENFIYKHIDKIIFVSKATYDMFFSTSPNIDKEKCCIIYNSIKEADNTIAFNVRERYGIDEASMILMFHGRIAREKGIETIIEALKYISINFKMIFVGTGDENYLQKVEQQICDADLKDKVIWVGHQKNVNTFVLQCDCGITPSIVPESFGLSNIEYMCAGKPLITTNNGAQSEYVKHGVTGFLVNPNAPIEIAKIVQRLYDKEYAQSIGSNAKKYFNEHLSYDKFYKRFHAIIFPKNNGRP